MLREQHGTLAGLSYMKTEKFGRIEEERRAIFDIYRESERGEKILFEMQKTKQVFSKDCTVYYSTFPIHEQANRSDWDYSRNYLIPSASSTSRSTRTRKMWKICLTFIKRETHTNFLQYAKRFVKRKA